MAGATTAGVLVALAAWASFGGEQLLPSGTGDDARLQALEKRLEEIEKNNREFQTQVLANLRALADGRVAVQASPEAQARREADRLHRQRLKNDDDYLIRHEQDRLNALQAELSAENVDPAWAEETSHHVGEALAYSLAESGAKLNSSSIDCRSTQCRIELDVPAGTSYEDILLHLNTDLAEALPRSRLVVMPVREGSRQVHIFASAPARPAPGREGD